ncbi:hypothetical protein RCO28_13650 [Streptomyces sp. LHD-70]|uniref:hypothetical protein n=1 Tax=Streptomyces sp. LHD-70 TaxID=3072140 RepID=UPI00280C91B4|nr:hypothetical protein [Streptomyces sp. LHD-70]MDQ8703522.1 hypothetical protein [Streptomyces sp. LHD-70]
MSARPMFGVEPEWVCIEPTTDPEKLNEDGGRLRPERPYLSFGSSDGQYLLWDTDGDGILKVPSKQTRSVPVDTGTASCPATP